MQFSCAANCLFIFSVEESELCVRGSFEFRVGLFVIVKEQVTFGRVKTIAPVKGMLFTYFKQGLEMLSGVRKKSNVIAVKEGGDDIL